MLDIQVAVAKIGTHAAGESGDTLEAIERPGGGLSLVLVDGQGTGRGAKTLSNLVTTRAISLLKDGARDSAVARAVHDYLYTYRMGQAAATLNILSVDFASGTILMSRNNPAPFFVLSKRGMQSYNEPSAPIGLQAMSKPVVTELPVEAYTYMVMFSDGLLKAGERYGEDLELTNHLAAWSATAGRDPNELTEGLLRQALELERGKPDDDISIVTLAVLPRTATHNTEQPVRRMQITFPFEPGGSTAPGTD
ncbi:MAG: serine/threonine-protein phosphatase [Chloroflexaceae bacterium]|jgi:serine phosphatase RsbU (regulator of sigma subunit)|nr:serine/threonine-protein phosphatase [Chloroflexaceae bacterium]